MLHSKGQCDFNNNQCDPERRHHNPSQDPTRPSDHYSRCDQHCLRKLVRRLAESIRKLFLNYRSCSCQSARHRLKQQAECTIRDNGVLGAGIKFELAASYDGHVAVVFYRTTVRQGWRRRSRRHGPISI